MNKQSFAIKNDFELNGTPFQLISGTIHYFRVVPEYWRDRLEKLKNMGCNTVEIYVPWNIHEPEQGQFVFNGICNITSFLMLAHELGLWVIFRPGPYICAEWEWGGLPYWLLKQDGIRVRSTDPRFINPMRVYFKELLSRITHLQIDRGGPIILMQVENEYGSYGNENAYMEAVRDAMLACDVTVPLVTSDGDLQYMQQGGSVKGAHPTANFGSQAEVRFGALRQHLRRLLGKEGPLMCMEFWIGWFDHWGSERHVTTPYPQNVIDLDYMLQHGHFNIYMFHGGTNFGFMNGSNYNGSLMPDVTSYDYDAPLSEDGKITDKYRAFKETIGRYTDVPEIQLTTKTTQKAYGSFAVTKRVSLSATLVTISVPVHNSWPLSMEQLNQGYGYTLYRSVIQSDNQVFSFRLLDANDRALVFLDGKKELALYGRKLLEEHKVNWDIDASKPLDILMENMGRVNFGPYLNRQKKGIYGEVLLNNHTQSGWEHWTLPMDWNSLKNIDYSKEYDITQPSFYQIEFDVDECADTYLDMSGWGKGFVLLNDFQLGRFWDAGPQKTLYIPAPLLRNGTNYVTVFETEGISGSSITFTDSLNLGHTQK